MAGDILGNDEQLLETLTLREKIDMQLATLAEGRTLLDALPHRRRYLLVIHDLGNRLLQTPV